MKNLLILLVFFILSLSSNGETAQITSDEMTQIEGSSNAEFVYKSQAIDLRFFLLGGYRIDQLDWNIAGYLGKDYWNVLSELIWQDLKIFQIELENETIINKAFYFRGELKKGWVFNGSNQDIDFNGNDRTNPWSQSKNDSDDGTVIDFSIGVGYIFNVLDQKFQLTPMIGVSSHEQNLTITNGYQKISKPILEKQIIPPTVGPFSGLNSSYESNWLGPWIGTDVAYIWMDYGRLVFSFEYHWADYYAEGNWNLITRFQHPKSFEHKADGHGVVFKTNWCSRFYKNWYYNLKLNYHRFRTDSGVDRTFFSDGSISETQLNEVNWESISLMLGFSCHF